MFEAIRNLAPSLDFIIRGEASYENIEWLNDLEQKPTEDEIATEMARVQAEFEAKEYARKRAPEYPPIGDQLDALFKAGVFPADMAAKIQAVKDKYPKV